MKLKLLLLVLFITITSYGQGYFVTPKALYGNYTPTEIDSGVGKILGDNFFRQVGGAPKNYPLTVQGLKDAIASLDSGTVYVSYPGLWDTTGLNYTKFSVAITGWFKGNYVEYLNKSTTTYNKKYFFGEQTAIKEANTIDYSYSKFTLADSRISWHAILRINAIQNQNSKIYNANSQTLALYNRVDVNPTSGLSYNAGAMQNTIIFDNASCSGYAAGQSYSTYTNAMAFKNVKNGTLWMLNLNDSYIDFGSGGALTTTNGASGYSFRIGSIGSGASLGGNFYAYRSDLSTNIAKLTGTKYHFYGLGNQPSYFGGSVNANAGFCYFTDAQASDTYVLTITGISSYLTGLEITFKANTANTDGATVNVNSLGAKNLTKVASGSVATALATGDIIAGQIVKAVYDGTQFQVISRLAQ